MGKISVLIHIILIIGLMIILLPPIFWESEEPELSIFLDDGDTENGMINVSLDRGNVLKYNGSINANFSSSIMGSRRVFVTLSANTGGWEWEISPSSTVLNTGEKTCNFVFTLTVPHDHQANRKNKITIYGEATSLPGLTSTTFRSKTLRVSVSPILNQSLSVSEERSKGTINKPTIILNNLGNVPMVSEMKVAERKILELEGWTFNFQEEGNLTVGAFQSLSNTLYIIPPLLPDIKDEEISINVTATSHIQGREGDGVNGSIETSIEIIYHLGSQVSDTPWDPDTGFDPTSEISLEKERRLMVLETLRFGTIGSMDFGAYLLILMLMVSIIYYLRFRNRTGA